MQLKNWRKISEGWFTFSQDELQRVTIKRFRGRVENKGQHLQCALQSGWVLVFVVCLKGMLSFPLGFQFLSAQFYRRNVNRLHKYRQMWWSLILLRYPQTRLFLTSKRRWHLDIFMGNHKPENTGPLKKTVTYLKEWKKTSGRKFQSFPRETSPRAC
jgi:hypothetical protein